MHEITLLQGLSLAALVFFLGIDFWLEALFLFRPIIVCTLTGAILGDIQTGLITGGLTELAFAGLTPAGGVQPPNPIMAGLMTTVIAWSTGVDAKTAIGLGLPFSLLMQYVILFFYSAFSLFMTKADKCAKEADTAAFSRLNWTTMLIVASAYAVIAFLCTYLAQGAMQALVKAMPAWLTHGFEVAGGILYSACCWFWLAAARDVQSTIYPLPDRRFPVCLLHPGQQPVAGCRTGRRLCGV